MTQTLPTGDVLETNRDAAVLRFAGRRKTLSTGALNGGLQADLQAVFNHNDCPRAGASCRMQGKTMVEHQTATAQKLGLPPDRVTGMNTGANTENTAVYTLEFEGLSVSAVVTAGLEVNGCRVGNAATLHERAGETVPLPGTVNIMVVIDANLTDGCMARALVTATQAKVAAVQELLVSDRYGPGLATGSGTDGIVIVSNSDSPRALSEAGEHYKLGELIGRAVKQGVKEALYRQSGLCPGMQHSVFRRLERFGVTPQAVWEEYSCRCDVPVSREVFATMMDQMSADGSVVCGASLYAHLLDQLCWGLLLPQETADTGARILAMLDSHHGMAKEREIPAGGTAADLAGRMAAAFVAMIADWVAVSS